MVCVLRSDVSIYPKIMGLTIRTHRHGATRAPSVPAGIFASCILFLDVSADEFEQGTCWHLEVHVGQSSVGPRPQGTSTSSSFPHPRLRDHLLTASNGILDMNAPPGSTTRCTRMRGVRRRPQTISSCRMPSPQSDTNPYIFRWCGSAHLLGHHRPYRGWYLSARSSSSSAAANFIAMSRLSPQAASATFSYPDAA